jgi:hypothetical protein
MSRINAAPTRFSAPREIRTTGKDARRPQSEGTTQGTLREVLSNVAFSPVHGHTFSADECLWGWFSRQN